MRGSRRGQTSGAGGAAFLIILIALLIVIYILVLPPEDRAALLGEEVSPGSQNPSIPSGNVPHRIFSAVPEVQEGDGITVKKLPTFSVRTVTSGNVLAARSELHVERSAFHQSKDEIIFTVPDRSENLLVTFGSVRSSGELIVSLNDQVVYKATLASRQGPVITLPKSLLLQPTNKLTFSTSPVGFQIWKKNVYDLTNVKVTADVTSVDEANQDHRFVIDDLDEVKSAHLSFIPECLEDAGKLTLELNSDIVYTGRPECDTDFGVDIALSRLDPDENTLSWAVSQGRYIISDVELAIEKELPETIETFTISHDILNRAAASGKEIQLSLSFADQGAEGVIELNGEELAFRTHRTSFSGAITSKIKPGKNTVRIVSSSTPITLLEVFMQ